jgi:hypothetical protein
MFNVCFLIVAYFAAFANASDFFDTTCAFRKCTLPRLSEVDHAKTSGIGTYSCFLVTDIFNPDLSVAATVTDVGPMYIQYNSTLGALVITNVFTSITYVIREYCNDHEDSACIYVSIQENSFILSKDQNKGPVGSTWRSIGYFDQTFQKKLTGMQQFLPAENIAIIMITNLDANYRISSSSLLTCPRI